MQHPCCQYPVLRASHTMVCCLPVFTKASVHSTSAKPMSCASIYSLLHMASEFIAVLPAGREETYVHAGNSVCVWDEGWRDGCDQDRASRPRYRQLSPLRCKTMLYSVYTLSGLIPLKFDTASSPTSTFVQAGMHEVLHLSSITVHCPISCSHSCRCWSNKEFFACCGAFSSDTTVYVNSGLEYVQPFIQHTHCRPNTHLPDHELIELVCSYAWSRSRK